MEEQNTSEDKPFSLIHPMAMGGIVGGDGYTFQERYIVCHIPKWLNTPHFVRIMHEGTGDVDVIFEEEGKYQYDHVQVKDHNITPTEFKEVINGFVKIDNGTGKEYRKFTLAAQSLNSTLGSLKDAIERYRGGESFFATEDKDTMLKTTKDALIKKIKDIGIEEHTDFILSKLYFDIGSFNFNDNSVCRKMFVASLVEHPQYKEYFIHLLGPVYSKLIEEVLAHRGKTLDHDKIHDFIKGVLTAPPKKVQDNVLHIHNWSVEKFDPEATITLDWSKYFDRSIRLVPDAEVWNTELVRQLYDTRQDIAKTTVNRHIILRGKCTLTTGFALGMAFPEIGNWSFELQQPPTTWRSDADKLKDYKLNYDTIAPETYGLLSDDQAIAVIFNITGQALEDVVEFIGHNNFSVKQLILINPSSTPGNLSIQNDSEAVSLACASKDIIKEMVTKYKAKRTHLFYFGPFGLSVFLGQKLTSVGQIQLYEFQDPGYKASCLLKT